jgi:hypothetical protein
MLSDVQVKTWNCSLFGYKEKKKNPKLLVKYPGHLDGDPGRLWNPGVLC